jgi:chromate transporter
MLRRLHHVLTDTQLNEAVVITRSTPGPVDLYIVSVGYFVAGVPGAVAGWLAMITPALLIIPLAQNALTNPIIVAIAAVSLGLLLMSKLDTLWIILGAAVVSLSAISLGVLTKGTVY